jgi:hypothetical protein
MTNNMTRDQADKIAAGIRQKYSEVAKNPEGQFQYPTGRKGLEALRYDKTLIWLTVVKRKNSACPTVVSSGSLS